MRTLGDLYGTVQRRAKKVGLAGNRSTFQGVDIKVKNLEMDVNDLGKNVARVTVRNGTVSYRVQRDGLAPTTKRLAQGAELDPSQAPCRLATSRTIRTVSSLTTIRI